jgi:hypothetical protein
VGTYPRFRSAWGPFPPRSSAIDRLTPRPTGDADFGKQNPFFQLGTGALRGVYLLHFDQRVAAQAATGARQASAAVTCSRSP